MEEKKEIKISLSTILLFLAIIAIIVMGYFIYKLNNDKKIEIQKSTNLQSQIDSLNDQEKLSNKDIEASSISQKVEKNSSNLDIEANIEVTPADILNEPLKYYGRSVLNYIEPYKIPKRSKNGTIEKVV